VNRQELERQALRGEDIGRLLDCDGVREVIEEHLAARREAIVALKSDQAETFARLKAGLEAVEDFLAAIESAAELGGLARQALADLDGGETGGRVL
jgi:hypothetical protein